MPPTHDLLRIALQGGMLFLIFLGAGLYLRGFWVYFLTIKWLNARERAELRRRYRRSALAALLREPGLSDAKRQCLLALAGLPLIALGGTGFNVLQNLAGR